MIESSGLCWLSENTCVDSSLSFHCAFPRSYPRWLMAPLWLHSLSEEHSRMDRDFDLPACTKPALTERWMLEGSALMMRVIFVMPSCPSHQSCQESFEVRGSSWKFAFEMIRFGSFFLWSKICLQFCCSAFRLDWAPAFAHMEMHRVVFSLVTFVWARQRELTCEC